MRSSNGEIVWQPVCEKRVDILSTQSKNSLLGLVLAVDGVEHKDTDNWFQNVLLCVFLNFLT